MVHVLPHSFIIWSFSRRSPLRLLEIFTPKLSWSQTPTLSVDLQHRTSLPSPLPCPLLSMSHLTVVTPLLYRPCPSIVFSSSHRLSATVLSLSHCLSVTVLSLSHHPPRRTITLVPSLHSPLSAYFFIILFFLRFHFYLLTPIYLYLYLYTLPFLAEIPIFSF